MHHSTFIPDSGQNRRIKTPLYEPLLLFLGGKGKWLASRKIPYNYEDSIVLLSNGNNDRSPGDHLTFGVRTIYDDKQFADIWFPVKKKAGGHFLLGFDGAHLSKSKGDLKIDDASRVHIDRIRLFARLAKDSAIGAARWRSPARVGMEWMDAMEATVWREGGGGEVCAGSIDQALASRGIVNRGFFVSFWHELRPVFLQIKN